MPFRVITVEPTTPAGFAVSSAFVTQDAALEFARDLVEAGVEVLRIEDDAGAVVYDGEAMRPGARRGNDSGPGQGEQEGRP